jgi:hypothetical protein
MKKNFKVFFFAAFVAVGLVSCDSGPKPLTEAEIAKKVDELTATQKKAVEAKLDAECTANMDGLTNEAVERILAEKRAAATAK